MKLLLTSAGITNESLKSAFLKLAPKEISECVLAFIPTAVNIEEDKSWMEKDIENFKKAGVKEIVMVDVERLKKEEWLPRFESSDMICFGGGNTYHLLNWVRKSGLIDELKELLTTRLYIGISTGSIIVGPDISYNGDLFPEDEKVDLADLSGLNYVPFVVAPHYLSPHFSDTKDENLLELSKKLNYPIYALDDDSAIVVEDGKQEEIISEGKWKRYN